MDLDELIESDYLDDDDLDPLERYLRLCAEDINVDLSSCLKNGKLNQEKLFRLFEWEEKLEAAKLACLEELIEQEEFPDGQTSAKNSYRGSVPGRKGSLKPYYFDDNGNRVTLQPKQTYWYLLYVRNPPTEDDHFHTKFRRRFRMPHHEYLKLLQRTKEHHLFARWLRKDALGREASPLELLVLGALRYLGRGLTFDDLEEYTAINEETHRQFFHVFIKWGSTDLYSEFVFYPKTAEEYSQHQPEFDIGGLHGAGFSTDATNVILWNCSASLKQAHSGFKNTQPSRSYNLSTNHRRRILHTTDGHPSRWNDKTLAWFDEFLCGVREGKILQDVIFTLLAWAGVPHNSAIVQVKYKGAWGLTDNGYHRWSCTQAPGKHDVLLVETRLSQWIESFRKDSECVFGILKGRFRVLKTGIRLQGTEAADQIWKTCCALHNLLLEVDGLDDTWSSEWEGELGNNDSGDMMRYAPFAVRRLEDPESFGSRQHELQSRRPVPARETETEEDDDMSVGSDGRGAVVDSDGAIFVNALSYSDFRDRLIVHFDILHSQRRIKWPRANNDNN